jgi:AmmeMemoRadiSam system protein B
MAGVSLATMPAACRGKEGEPAMKNAPSHVVFKARGGGRWFPGSGPELDQMVRACISNAHPPAVTGRIVAAIAPHAGYIYSGPVAGYTFRAIADNARTAGAPDVAVVIGFSHRGAYRGVALLDADAIATPLGEAALDREAGRKLTAGSPLVYFQSGPHEGEHSAENEIPFLQTALPGVKLVVALMGDHEPDTLDALATALLALARDRRVLVVASTDLLHDPDYDLVARTDKATLERIAALDVDGLLRSWNHGNQVCCGIGPVAAAMRAAAAQRCRQGTLLHYRNSGDDHPESRGSWVVGYGAVVFATAASKPGS